MDSDTRVQILNEAVSISHSTNTPGKGMNSTILPTAMGKWYDRLGYLILIWQPVEEKENPGFKNGKG